MIKVNFTNSISNLDHIVILVDDKLNLPDNISILDSNVTSEIKKFLKSLEDFKAKFGDMKHLTVPVNKGYASIKVISIGSEKEITNQKLENIGGRIFKYHQKFKEVNVLLVKEEYATHLAFGFGLAAYDFDKYKTVKKPEEKKLLQAIHFIVQDSKKIEKDFDHNRKLQDAIFWTRDLVNEVPNVLNPEEYARRIVDQFKPLGVEVEVLEEDKMRKLGMNALLGVAQGSVNKPKLVVLKYNNAEKDSKPFGLVGKGVTFDTGGISLKPADSMHLMKYDMGGSAAVVGAVSALAKLKAKVNIVAAVALVENMPDGKAQRPGDVVKTMSGQTVEVLNTDAEGRLILADALWYVQDKFKPSHIINLATLTGAIVVSLGSSFSGCFSNDDKLADKIIETGKEVNELVWRMPLHEDFEKMIVSEVADWANIGSVRGAAGSATAAHFLEKFVNKTPWAHLDIAGMAWEHGLKDTCPNGATGYGVRLLTKLLQDHYA